MGRVGRLTAVLTRRWRVRRDLLIISRVLVVGVVAGVGAESAEDRRHGSESRVGRISQRCSRDCCGRNAGSAGAPKESFGVGEFVDELCRLTTCGHATVECLGRIRDSKYC